MSANEPESSSIGSEHPVEGGASRSMDPAFKRNLLIIGGIFGVVALVLVVLFWMRSGKTEQVKPTVDIGLAQSTQANPDGEQLSPAMKQAITAQLERERKAKLADGKVVVMPTETVEQVQPIETPATPVAKSTPEVATDPGSPATPAAAPALSTEELARLERRRQGMEQQIGNWLTTVDSGRQPVARVVFSGSQRAGQQPSNQAMQPSGRAPAPVQTVNFTPTRPGLVVDENEIVAAETASPIDTYKTSYASARIVAGKLDGAILFGTVKQQEDGLQVHYTRMRLGNQSYQVDAIGLDQKTSTDALDASVDRRYLQRWVFPVMSAAVGGFMQAKSKTGSTVVVVGADGTGVAVPAPDAEQARAAGIAAGFTLVQREVEREAAKPYQIRMAANTPIGILFRQPVAAKVTAAN